MSRAIGQEPRTPGPLFRRGAGALFILLAASSCGERTVAEKTTPPATVQHAVKEAELATITLTEDAERRLGLTTTAIESREVHRTRVYGGEIIVPSGRQVTVSAPVAGRLAAPEGRSAPAAGAMVRSGDTLFRLFALPPEHDLLRGQEDLAQAGIRRDQARQRVQRAERLLKDRAGSVRALEEAQAELAAAEAALAAASGRLDLLSPGGAGHALDTLTPVAISSPLTGAIGGVHAQAGQIVPGGASLIDIIDTATVWVRVPIYVGDLSAIGPRSTVEVHGPSEAAGSPGKTARPIDGPPTADPGSASVDMFWELPNGDGSLRPGQRVGVTVPLAGAEVALVAPWAAVLHDIYGGTWVYESAGSHTYVRRRVAVRYVAGDVAVLDRGPKEGTLVVTAGAAELFGTEFATGK